MSRLDENRNSKYGYLAKYPTARLQELLMLEGDNVELICEIMEVIKEREGTQSTGGAVDVDVAWQEFQQYYLRELEEMPEEFLLEPPAEPTSEAEAALGTRKIKFKGWRTIVAVAAVIVTLNIVTLAAAGMNLFQAIATWSDEAFSFSSGGGQHVTALGLDVDAEDKVEKFNAGVNFLPTRIPEGFTFYQCSEMETDSSYVLDFFFLNDSEQIFKVTAIKQLLAGSTTLLSEKDGQDIEIYSVGAVDHYIYNNLGFVRASWAVDNLEFHITGPITRDELIDVIKSIYP